MTSEEQDSVDYSVGLLEEFGVALKRPHADAVRCSRFKNMRELRCQHEGQPLRILYAFDPRRTAMLLLGGDKTGKKDWYASWVPKADRIYEQHFHELDKESPNHGAEL